MCSLAIRATTVLDRPDPLPAHAEHLGFDVLLKSLNPCAKNMGNRMGAAATAQPSKRAQKPGVNYDLGAVCEP